MRAELFGMTDEELIQWACQHGRIRERKLRQQMLSIELFCAQHPIGMGSFIERVVFLVNTGVRLHRAITLTMKENP